MSMEEEQKTLEYQETMKVYVENIAKNQNNWKPIYEVIHDLFFAVEKFVPPEF